MNLGLFSQSVRDSTALETAIQIKKWGFNAVQLYYGFKDLTFKREELDAEKARKLQEAFQDLKVVTIDGFINPVHPDRQVRKKLFESLVPAFRWARTIGTDTIGMMTGSFDEKSEWNYHSYNHTPWGMRELIDVMKDVTAEAERYDVRVCVEPCAFCVANSPRRALELIEGVGSDRLGVMFDPGAMAGPLDVGRTDQMIRESFDLLGESIWVVHVQDIAFSPTGHKWVQMGDGIIDWDVFFEQLRKTDFQGDLVIEVPGTTREKQRQRILDELGDQLKGGKVG